MENMKSVICRCILAVVFSPKILSDPTGCTYDADLVLYTCSARGWVLPLAYADFSVQPQRLLLKDVAGELPASAPNGPTFSGFVNMVPMLFNTKYSPSFHIMCYAKSSLIISKDTFQDFGWVEDIIIQDCDILSLPVEIFSHFGEINSLIIEGGSITNMVADSFKGLDVKKITTALTPKGELIIRNSRIVSGQLEFGALFSMNNVAVIILDNNHITSLMKDTFYQNPKVTNLSISHNEFTSIPDNLFSASPSLGHVSVWGVQWSCMCTDLMFLDYVINNNITLNGDLICSTPAAVASTTVISFYSTNCVSYSPCDGIKGVAVGAKCLTVIEIVTYTLVSISTVVVCITFGLAIHLYNSVKKRKNRKNSIQIIKKTIAAKLADVIENKIRSIQESYAEEKYQAIEAEGLSDKNGTKKKCDESQKRYISTPLYWRESTQIWPNW